MMNRLVAMDILRETIHDGMTLTEVQRMMRCADREIELLEGIAELEASVALLKEDAA
jgi:hypothetical protein